MGLSWCLSSKGHLSHLPMEDTQDRFLGQEYTLEQAMATHSSILVWRIPWTQVPGRLQSMGSQEVGHDLVIEQQQILFLIATPS